MLVFERWWRLCEKCLSSVVHVCPALINHRDIANVHLLFSPSLNAVGMMQASSRVTHFLGDKVCALLKKFFRCLLRDVFKLDTTVI